MLEPILNAPFHIQLHVVAALSAIVLTPVQFLRRRGDRPHKIVGYVWVLSMAMTALSSFWIHQIRLVGPFSPIHLLSVFVLFSLGQSIRAARQGNIRRHRAEMASCAFWGLGVAGIFTLLPGRLMSQVLFGPYPWAGFAVMAALFCLWALRYRQRVQAHA